MSEERKLYQEIRQALLDPGAEVGGSLGAGPGPYPRREAALLHDLRDAYTAHQEKG